MNKQQQKKRIIISAWTFQIKASVHDWSESEQDVLARQKKIIRDFILLLKIPNKNFFCSNSLARRSQKKFLIFNKKKCKRRPWE